MIMASRKEQPPDLLTPAGCTQKDDTVSARPTNSSSTRPMRFFELKQLSVFSSGATEESIGTSFKLDITLTYLLRKDEVGDLHRESASTYRQVIESRARPSSSHSMNTLQNEPKSKRDSEMLW